MIRWDDPALTGIIGGGYLGLLTLQWGALLWGLPRYGGRWRIEGPDPPQKALPPVTVCIPARNEEANIGACVRAVLTSEARDLEVILVDDHSTDRTLVCAEGAAGGDPRFHVLRGQDRPPDWAGKAWALSQATANAAHDVILFLDADVRIHPGAIGTTLARMETHRLDLLSVFGTWDLDSFWERLVIPVVGWIVRGSVNLESVNDPCRPDAFANGQFILVRRSAYEAVGGHRAVRREVLDDVGLAKVMKAASFRLGLFYAPWAFRVRLYRNLREIVDGYTKNFYEGMGRAPHVALGLVLFVVIGTLSPFLIALGDLAAYLFQGWVLMDVGWMAWVLALCAMVLAFRFRLERMEGRSGLHALGHPVGGLFLIWIVLRSMMAVDVEWKGRTFRDGKAS